MNSILIGGKRGSGRGRGLWFNIMAVWLVVTVLFISLYWAFFEDGIFSFSEDYILIPILLFVLVFGAFIIKSKSCTRTPRGVGKSRVLFAGYGNTLFLILFVVFIIILGLLFL